MNGEGQGSPVEDRQQIPGSPWEDAAEAAARIIQQRSRQGQLSTGADVHEELAALNFFLEGSPDPSIAMTQTLAGAMERHVDLQEIAAVDGTRHLYSSDYMTEIYARLLVRKEGEPLQLMAGVVRENSALYPRPFPLGAFEQLPFAMTREKIVQCLDRMAGLAEYRDIARTTTSAGHVYLYSTLHLDSDYAAGLAEWIDVGQQNNP